VITWARVFRPGLFYVRGPGSSNPPHDVEGGLQTALAAYIIRPCVRAAARAHSLRWPPARRRGKTTRARSALDAQRSSFFVCRWRSRRSQSASEDHASRPRLMVYVAASRSDVAAGLQTRLTRRGRSSDRPGGVYRSPLRSSRGQGAWSPPASGSTPRKNASRTVCPCRAPLVVFRLPLALAPLAVGQRRPCVPPATHGVRGRES